MLSIARRALNHLPERDTLLSVVSHDRKLNNSRLNFDNSFSIGLRLVLDQISHPDSAAAGVLVKKPANTVQFIPNIPISSPQTPDSNQTESGLCCFLKSCRLCKKRLSAKDDIYMYMGDQGFCSVECRSRQIAMDERKEIEEALDRRVLAQYSPSAAASGLPKCPEGGNCETCRLLEDLRERRRRRKKAIPVRR